MTILARLAAVAVLAMTGTPVLAAPQAASTAPAQASTGLNVEEVRAWLEGLGADSSTLDRANDQIFLRVQDGPLAWGIFFYGCQGDVCSDLQFTSVFNAGPEVTLERLNQWNVEKRYLKAFYLPAQGDQEAAVVAQYDVIAHGGEGVDQLREPTVVWVEMVREFAAYVGFTTAETPAAATPPAQ